MLVMVCSLAAAVACCLAGPPAATDAPSFLTEVMPVLTRQGCNQGGCHGKGAGQNGFRLSLRGYAPDQDHRSITREFDGRRVDPADPARSLFLLKAAGLVPHDGGKLFGAEGREYRTLLRWLEAGAPGPNEKEPRVVKLELTPGGRTAAAGDVQPLTAWATFSDGRRRDVTWLTRFDSNDAAVVAVTPSGVATANRPGATAVRAAFLTEVAVAAFTVPAPAAVASARYDAPPHPVDDAVFAQLKALHIEPSGPATDAEFVRRVTLDTIGRLPAAPEAAAFVADTSPDKRAKYIDALLARPEFADYWALFLGDLFQNRKERDHDVRGAKGVRQFHTWLREQVVANRPWDELARAVLTAAGDTTANPAVGYYVVTVGEQREADKSEVGESVAQAFLGTRIGCAKCHNHPLEKFTQDDFYHFAAFFSRVQLDRREAKDGVTTLRVGHRDGRGRDKDAVGTTQPRTGAHLKPQPLDRSTPAVPAGGDPRAPLAAWVTGPTNEVFAGAMVNRVWKHYLGVGLVDPVDDLRATNPPSNPALWAALCKEFVGHRFDLKHLMRVILTSRTYQLSSSTRPGNAADARAYSHYYARRLPAEVFLDAVCDVTGVPETFAGYPVGTRAVQVPDPSATSPFLKLFGQSERTTACACERKGDVTLSQLLHLQNSPNLANKAAHGPWLKAQLAATRDDAEVLDRITRRAFARPATAAERAAVTKLLADKQPRAEVFADFLWAVLNAKDFAFNH